MKANAKILLLALAAGGLGLAASLLTTGPGPLWRTELGQRALNAAATASAPPPPAGVAVARRGEPLPAFRLPGLDGATQAVPGTWAGRPLLINVWASWCGPCIEEMPALEAFSREQGDKGVQVVGIALDDADAVRAFLQRVPVGYPILVDAPGPADAGVRLGNPKGVLPYSVLVSADGRLLKQRIGPFAAGEIAGWAAP
ncbi:MAG TPA: TlpA disulfide reductase family protein [Xanthomonadaceae bacterium]|nr:TlpA disulfide reductase family protein [Xanthomonadaceae bacterium]